MIFRGTGTRRSVPTAVFSGSCLANPVSPLLGVACLALESISLDAFFAVAGPSLGRFGGLPGGVLVLLMAALLKHLKYLRLELLCCCAQLLKASRISTKRKVGRAIFLDGVWDAVVIGVGSFELLYSIEWLPQ